MELSLAQEVAEGLINEYLNTNPKPTFLTPWRFKWDHAKARFGQCCYSSRTISLSKPLTLTNTEAEVLDTILHEIAHALVGPGAGHGPVWQAKAVELGAKPYRWKTAKTAPKYVGICNGCHKPQDLRERLGQTMKKGLYIHKSCYQAADKSLPPLQRPGRIFYKLNRQRLTRPELNKIRSK